MGSLVAELAEKLSSATNNFDIDEGTIYVNTSADTVAIGGTSPDGKFSIHQSVSADILNLYDGTDVVFTVLDGGNVGIGTSAPEHIFHLEDVGVNSFKTKAVFDLEGTRNSGFTQSTLELAPASSGGTFRTRAIAAELVSDQSASELVFYSESTEHMRITSAGRVGISSTSPGTLLELAADAESTIATIATYSATNAHVPSLYLEKSHSDTLGTNTATADNEYLGEIKFAGFSNDNTIVYSSIIRAVQDGSPSTSTIGTDLEFYTQANGSAMGDARMIIKSDGNVGIGTTAPDGTLHIHTGSAGSITADSNSNNLVVENSADAGISILSPQGYYQRLYFGHDADADAGQIVYGGANVGFAGNRNHMLFYTNGSEKMRITSDGKVGIGSNTPNQNLDVLNTVQITGAEGTSASLYLVADEGDDNGDGWRINSNQDANDLTISNNTSGSYVDKVTFLTDGKVGIGTTAPEQTLHVKTSTSAVPITFGVLSNSTALPAISFNGAYASTTMAGIYGNGATASNLYYTVPSGRDHIFSIADVTKMVIDDSGNVGIGESSPAFLLHVAGTLGIKTAQPTLTFDRGGAYAWTIRNGDGTGSFPLSTLNIVNNGGSPKMTFLDNGHVGIGTTAPGYLLNVKASVATWVTQLENSSTSGNVYAFRLKFNSNPYDTTSKFLECTDSTGDRFQVFSDGTVKNSTGTYGTISDERIKTDIVDAESQWDDIKAVRVRNFKRKAEGDRAIKMIGVVAQELEKVSPGLIDETPPDEWTMEHCGFGKKVDGKWVPKQVDGKDMTVKGVSTSILYMKAFKALQEAMAKIETLETKVKTLEDAG